MRRIQLPGASGPVAICKITMGTQNLGSLLGREESFALLDRYYALGGRTIDTARCYGQDGPEALSRSERMVGEWMAARGLRDELCLITKGAFPSVKPDNAYSRVTPACIRRDLEDSLACLGVERVDLLFLHRDDPQAAVGPIMESLHALVEEGKTRAVGASNWTAARIREANDYAAAHALTPFTASQIQWSLAQGSAELWGDSTLVFMNADEYRAYRELCVPVMAFSPQAKGFYAKYLAGGEAAAFGKSERFLTPDNIAKARALQTVAARRGVSPSAVLLAYITSNPLEGAAVVGCMRLEHLEDSMSAPDLRLTAEEFALLEQSAE